MLGLFGVRSDHRGLATLSRLMLRHLEPDKTVVIDMGRHSPTVFHHDIYGSTVTTVTYDDLLAGDFDLDAWLDGLDTVLTFEIPYDARLYETCRRRGIKTVQLTMPELDAHHRDGRLPPPDVFALPTTWMANRYPGCPVLPVPSDPWKASPGDLVVHPGSLAMKDRNGTRVVLDASARTRWPIVVRAQTSPDRPHGRATVEIGDLDESRELFDGAALVVIPRRYGGLSIVIQEALSAGLPILLPESDPYAHLIHPAGRMRATEGRNFQAKGGTIFLHDVAARDVAAAIEAVMGDDGLRKKIAAQSRKWARDNTWEKVRAVWDAELGVTVDA